MNGVESSPMQEESSTQTVQQESKQKRNGPLATWLVRLLKAAVTVGLLYILVSTISREALIEAFKTADTTFIILAVLLVPLNLLLQGERWTILVHTEIPDIPYKRVFASFLGGLSLGLITPGRVGEIGRVFLLEAPSRWRLAGLHILDKLYFVGAVTLIGPALLYWMPGFHEALPENLRAGTVILVSLLPLLYFFIALYPSPIKWLLLVLQLAMGAKGKVLELLRAYEGIQPRHSIQLTAITLVQFVVILTQFWLLSLAFESVPWLTAAHTYAAALFVKTALPVSLGSLGVGEWAAVSFYQRYGIAEATGFSASMILFGINVLVPGLLGLFVLYRMRPQALLRRLGLARGEES